MGIYEPLARKLGQTNSDEFDASFGEIEQILGRALPQSARKHRPWWGNNQKGGHSQAQAWIGAGWETRDVDLGRQRVRFVRTAGKRGGTSENADLDLWSKAQFLTGISDRRQLEEAALRALIQQAAAGGLARLGGTMPDAISAPRERRGA